MKKRIFASAATFGLTAFMSVNAQVNINAATTNVTGTTANLNSTTTNIGATGTTANLKAATTTVTGTTTNLNASTTNVGSGVLNVNGGTTNIKSGTINFRTSANYAQYTTHNGYLRVNGAPGLNYEDDVVRVTNKEIGSASGSITAVHGISKPADGFGYGGVFEGGLAGVIGKGINSSGNNWCYGGQFLATSSYSNNCAVYASANGGAQNYAGYFDGQVMITGALSSPSDEKLKNNIAPLTGSLDLVMKLNPVDYYYDTATYTNMHLPSKKQRGFVAQDVEKILPDLVKTERMPQIENKDGNQVIKANPTIDDTTTTFKGVNYIAMIPILVGAIQEQQKRIEELEKIVGKRY